MGGLCEQRAQAKIQSPTALTDTLEAGPTAEEAGPWGMTDCRAAAPAARRRGPTATSVCVVPDLLLGLTDCCCSLADTQTAIAAAASWTGGVSVCERMHGIEGGDHFPARRYNARVDYIWANTSAARLWRVVSSTHVELLDDKEEQQRATTSTSFEQQQQHHQQQQRQWQQRRWPLTDHALVMCELEHWHH